jgi:chromosome segregation ATPase
LGTLKQLEKEARQLESTNTKLENVLGQAEKDHERLLEELKSKESTVSATNRKIEQLSDEESELREKMAKLERECEKSKGEYQDLCQALDGASNKNKDLAGKLKNLDNSVRISESELDQATLKRENLRKEHLDLANENKILNGEIDKVLLSILEYERINKDLQKEIENYIECDEEARHMLNRKETMRSLLDQVSVKLQKTEEQIAHLR